MMSKIYKVNDVADYVILKLNSDEDYQLVNLKLQKLVYYIQAWHLGIHGTQFHDGTFQAWVHGPVCRALYDRFKDGKTLYSPIGKNDVINKDVRNVFKNDDIEFMDYILENYARFTGSELEAMTHNEAPWIEARHGIPPMEHCENEISTSSMLSFYKKRYEEIPD